MDLQYQVRESLSALSAESAARLERHQEEHRLTTEFGLPPTLENMTEQEAVAFAMMLSLDEQEQQHQQEAADEEGWEQPPEDWLEGDELFLDEDLDRAGPSGLPSRGPNMVAEDDDDRASSATSRGESRSQSLSVSPSPYLRGASLSSGYSPSLSPRNVSYTWTPISPSLRAIGSLPSAHNPHGKVQVSPRLGPTYGSAGATYSTEAVPDMSPELWPTACSPPGSGLHASFASRRTSTGASSPLGPTASGLPPISGTSSSRAGTPVRRGWSEVARSASSTPASSNSPSLSPTVAPRASAAWPSPPSAAKLALPPTGPGTGSLLSEQLRYSEISAQQDEQRRRQKQEEDDVRYAIELSLAEEASRLTI